MSSRMSVEVAFFCRRSVMHDGTVIVEALPGYSVISSCIDRKAMK